MNEYARENSEIIGKLKQKLDEAKEEEEVKP
jgi:hypothetical protein